MLMKKHIYIKLTLTLLLIVIFFMQALPIFATNTTPAVSAPSCILMDMNTGKILYSKNSNEKMFPASTTKVMTAILTLENCNLTDIVTISHDAIYNVPYGYSTASLFEGEQLTVDQLLHVLLIPSANDAAFALAEHISGSVSNFADMMNAKATELGCKSTHFVNPNGIHNENHYSTAYDLALIGQYAMKNDIFREIVSNTKYSLPSTNKYTGTERMFNTTNELINPNSKYYYKYATGAKTGYTEIAKSCIIATAKKDNEELLVVILHDEKTDSGISTREIDCKTLFEYGFNNYSSQTIVNQNTIAKNISISNATSDTKSLDLLVDKDIVALNPNDYSSSDISSNIVLNSDIKAPISKGETLGTIYYTSDDFTYQANLIASHDVFEFDYKKTIMEIILVIVFLIILTLITRIRKNKNSQKIYNTSSKKRKNKNYRYKKFDFYPHI